MSKKYNKDRGRQARDSGHKNKKTVAAATGPSGALCNQGTAKNAANFDQTHDAMTEYVGFLLGPVASKAARTLTRPVNTIREKPGRKYPLVAPQSVEEGVTVVIEVTDKYNADNSKNNLVVNTENWRLTMNVYMKEYDNHMRDKRRPPTRSPSQAGSVYPSPGCPRAGPPPT